MKTSAIPSPSRIGRDPQRATRHEHPRRRFSRGDCCVSLRGSSGKAHDYVRAITLQPLFSVAASDWTTRRSGHRRRHALPFRRRRARVKALAEKGINIRAITTSEIKFSMLIDEVYTELAVRTLHTFYGLDAKG
jgi:hypothetical protein